MIRRVLAVAGVVTIGAGATAVDAQQSLPTLTVGVGKTAVTLQGADGIKGGPTKIVFTNPDKLKENFGVVFALRSGATVDDFKRAVGDGGINAVWGMGQIQASATLEGANASRTMTTSLQPGGSYLAIQGNGEDPKKWAYTPFTVAPEANGATAAKPSTTVNMDDFAFSGSKTLPRNGTIRFRNIGSAPHFAIAFRLKKGASASQAGRLIRTNKEREFDRLVAGATEAQPLVSAGAVNDTEVEFPGAGTYLFVCFFGTGEKVKSHHEIGMYRSFTVR